MRLNTPRYTGNPMLLGEVLAKTIASAIAEAIKTIRLFFIVIRYFTAQIEYPPPTRRVFTNNRKP